LHPLAGFTPKSGLEISHCDLDRFAEAIHRRTNAALTGLWRPQGEAINFSEETPRSGFSGAFDLLNQAAAAFHPVNATLCDYERQ
jgi:hypothetical protein